MRQSFLVVAKAVALFVVKVKVIEVPEFKSGTEYEL